MRGRGNGVDVVTISTLAECHCLSGRHSRVTTRQYCGRTERGQTFGVNSTRVVTINQKRGGASRIADERQGKRSRLVADDRSHLIRGNRELRPPTRQRSPRTSAIIIVRSITRRVRFGVSSVISMAFVVIRSAAATRDSLEHMFRRRRRKLYEVINTSHEIDVLYDRWRSVFCYSPDFRPVPPRTILRVYRPTARDYRSSSVVQK